MCAFYYITTTLLLRAKYHSEYLLAILVPLSKRAASSFTRRGYRKSPRESSTPPRRSCEFFLRIHSCALCSWSRVSVIVLIFQVRTNQLLLRLQRNFLLSKRQRSLLPKSGGGRASRDLSTIVIPFKCPYYSRSSTRRGKSVPIQRERDRERQGL